MGKNSQTLLIPKKTIKNSSASKLKLQSDGVKCKFSHEAMQNFSSSEQEQFETKNLESIFQDYIESSNPLYFNSEGDVIQNQYKISPNNKLKHQSYESFQRQKQAVNNYIKQNTRIIKPQQPKQTSNNVKFETQQKPKSDMKCLELWNNIKLEAQNVVSKDPLLQRFYNQTILKHKDIKEALAFNLSASAESNLIQQEEWKQVIERAFKYDSTLQEKMVADLEIIKEKDASWKSHINSIINMKGFQGLGLSRVSQILFRNGHQEWSYIIQKRVSELYGMDIHPGSQFEEGIFFDHATGIVVGETAKIGSGTVLLHNVTLGATGKEPYGSDRHPSIGKNCYIGANVSLLGNIQIGQSVKIGAGAICLQNIPDGKTFVGGIKGRLI